MHPPRHQDILRGGSNHEQEAFSERCNMTQANGHSERAIPPVVSVDWLHEQLGNPNVRVLDASWYLPAMQRDANLEYRAAHIPGAVRADPDVLSDPDTDLPHMLP